MTTPLTCPDCGTSMSLWSSRRSKDEKDKFWLCDHYPVCTGARDTDGTSRAERDAERQGQAKN